MARPQSLTMSTDCQSYRSPLRLAALFNQTVERTAASRVGSRRRGSSDARGALRRAGRAAAHL
jgi:hypothetical protein